MDNIGDILSSLSDDDMKALGDAARSLLGSAEQEQEGGGQGFSLDPTAMAKIAQIMGAMNRRDSRCDLIAALRPLLSEPRRRRADDAMQLIKLIDLLPMIEELGGNRYARIYGKRAAANARESYSQRKGDAKARGHKRKRRTVQKSRAAENTGTAEAAKSARAPR